jgi:hypothetical protein
MAQADFSAFYERYRAHCVQAGIEPRCHERAIELMAQWGRAGLAASCGALHDSEVAVDPRIH